MYQYIFKIGVFTVHSRPVGIPLEGYVFSGLASAIAVNEASRARRLLLEEHVLVHSKVWAQLVGAGLFTRVPYSKCLKLHSPSATCHTCDSACPAFDG
jgi:hypothetical protein